MSPQFSDDDTGKRVVNADGDKIGIVADVDHGTAHVEPDPGITDTIKAKLGWGDTGEDTYPLQEESVARVTDDEVRLQSDLSGSGTTGGMTDAETSGTTGTNRDRGIDRDENDISGTDDDDESLLGDDTDDRRR
ncbi:hypothetical protein [Natrinema halophilum]|uniref:PRC-barrel domain containing protein n=1 Tax=Natrinema halophilum TaxID=1699371 RepID=A0A7D5K4G7_9EURY|nr:hypothetical protein [Natrinema halophilum]QLG47543.1 hypothetical protein HYG82_01115 [Natrinema halophilum]